jgi:uncharacterized membrane protein
MLRFERSATIGAPVEKVFDYIADRSHLPAIWPSLIEVKDVKRLPAGGYTFTYVYKLADTRFEGKGEDTEFLPKERLVTKITGSIEGTFTFRFEPVGTETKVHFAVAYTLPAAFISKLGEPYLAKANEREAELLLQNLNEYFKLAITKR